jgi:thiol-disulfide isomerase/thioredoxin
MAMTRLSSYRVLVAGLASPLAAALLGTFVYRTLTGASADRDADFVFRLCLTALVMAVPFLATLALAIADRRRNALTTAGKVGLVVAFLSVGLAWVPIRGALARTRQARNLALQDVAAPPFDTVDIFGKRHRLADHAGKVVLVNVWATWCPPCKKEMPELERLYQARKDQGLVVFGFSTEDLGVQQKFAKDEISVSYPLLTADGQVPDLYRGTAKYPANFLIDRQGRLQPAPSTEQPFQKLEAAVDALLVGAR